MGPAVGGGGDVNGAGVPNVVVGSRCTSPADEWSGRTYVVFGRDFSREGG